MVDAFFARLRSYLLVCEAYVLLHLIKVIQLNLCKPTTLKKHARIQEFLSGGPGQSDKKALTTFF